MIRRKCTNANNEHYKEKLTELLRERFQWFFKRYLDSGIDSMVTARNLAMQDFVTEFIFNDVPDDVEQGKCYYCERQFDYLEEVTDFNGVEFCLGGIKDNCLTEYMLKRREDLYTIIKKFEYGVL